MHDASALGILLMVHILFIISMLCGLALVGAMVAIVHHVRTNQGKNRQEPPPAPSFEEHLKAATEYGSPRSTRMHSHQTVQSITAQKDPVSPSPKDGLHIVHRSSGANTNTDLDSRNDDIQARPLHVVSGLRSASAKRF